MLVFYHTLRRLVLLSGCRYFNLFTVATFWALSLVRIYRGRGLSKGQREPLIAAFFGR